MIQLAYTVMSLDLSFEAKIRSHLTESFVGDVCQQPSPVFTDEDSDDDLDVDSENTELDVLSTCTTVQREVNDRIRSRVLTPLCNQEKRRTLAQLACCYRLQRTLDVQARSVALAERLRDALRQRDEQLDVGTEADHDARRQAVGKLHQVTIKMENYTFIELKNSDAESTLQLEEQIYTYQCLVETALRSLANICTLVKQQTTPGEKEHSTVAGDIEALFAELPIKYRRERL